MNKRSQRRLITKQKARVVNSFHDLVDSSEGLLRTTASYTGSEIEGARARLREQLRHARGVAADWEGTARDRYQRASTVTDAYVHDNAWKSIGVAALFGLLIGALVVGGSSSEED